MVSGCGPHGQYLALAKVRNSQVPIPFKILRVRFCGFELRFARLIIDVRSCVIQGLSEMYSTRYPVLHSQGKPDYLPRRAAGSPQQAGLCSLLRASYEEEKMRRVLGELVGILMYEKFRKFTLSPRWSKWLRERSPLTMPEYLSAAGDRSQAAK